MYGIEKFCDNIESMIGSRPNLFWRTCWTVVSPLFLVIVVTSAIISSGRLSFHSYLFPDWATAVGWLFSLSSVAAVPLLFIAFHVRRAYASRQPADSTSV